MDSGNTGRQTRAEAIADGGIAVIARDGLRALTHRAVDREAGIPQGSSSYYAPTRRALLDLIVQRLAQRTTADASQAIEQLGLLTPAATPVDRVTQLAAAVSGLIDTLAARGADMRARYALLLELDRSQALHAALSTRSEVQTRGLAMVQEVLERFGVADPRRRGIELMKLADAMVFQQVVVDPAPSAVGSEGVGSSRGVIESYLRGIIPQR
ncbi:TetR/AcrR family transcriptional regulator [Rhodococcus xishaensis]|uniref:TetR family transcriptional regulator n=1 Tax=Rhodococcus xishaensis TaxID=2487364 RepID=A0A3S3A7Q5_9NOCA|nr:TetR family transcriptional regulator [Rhodococcus xishaensis]RVW03923.1 TetR family transcriptional regulator [Rhodococcus xishaensis]